MGFLSVIFIIVLGFYVLGILGRLWLRWWILRKQKEFAEGSAGGFYSYGSRSHQKKRSGGREGDVTVEKMPGAGSKRVSGNVGDYVEFEEVGDENDKK